MKTLELVQQSGRFKKKRPTLSPEALRLEISDEEYILLFNTLATSLLGEGADLLLEKLADLPTVIEHYSARLPSLREACDTELYFRTNQVACFLKKLEYSSNEDAVARSFKKWLDAEAGCKEQNMRCWEVKTRPLTHTYPELARVLDVVRKEISDLLPEIPPDYDHLARWMKFGPGATLTHNMREGSTPFKIFSSSAYRGMEGEVEWLTYNSMFCEPLQLEDFEGSFSDDNICREPRVEYFDVATLAYVPKSISEVRWIEIGPSLATYFQQGFDGFIRQRLKDRWGVDLTDQRPNQRLARIGSLSGPSPNSPCTIDLSSASDRISYGVVAMLLPPAWVRSLSAFRAPKVRTLDGTEISLEKFSSMGNAYTFSLQTLIFSAVVRANLRARGWEGSRWRVYGDDIVIPHRIYDDVVADLVTLGFEVNREKSFKQGFFRESCGADYLLGTNVRAFYLKKPIRDVAVLFRTINLVQEFAASSPITARAYEELYCLLLSWVPTRFFLVGNMLDGLDSCVRSPLMAGRRLVLRWHGRERRFSDKKSYFRVLFDGYRKYDPLERVVSPDSRGLQESAGYFSIEKSRNRDRSAQCGSRAYLEPLLLKR